MLGLAEALFTSKMIFLEHEWKLFLQNRAPKQNTPDESDEVGIKTQRGQILIE